MYVPFAFLLLVTSDAFATAASAPTVVVLSFDGLRPDHVTAQKTPFLHGLMAESYAPEYMRSVFPTKTFVTHFTLATGVYPDVHGVYGNRMFDIFGQELHNTQKQFQDYTDIVPIWIENENPNDGRHSGVMMWPGSEFAYRGKTPTYVQPYNSAIQWSDRANTILDWMSQSDNRANLVMAYFENSPCYSKTKYEKHLTGHLNQIDHTIKKIYLELENSKTGDFDMIVMSDHGTSQVTYKNVLITNNIILPDMEVRMIISGPILFIKVNHSLYKRVLNKLKNKPGYGSKFSIYTNKSFRDEWHMNGLSYFENIITVVASVGLTFYEETEFIKLRKANEIYDIEDFVIDVNGYDNYKDEMNAFFMGIGPKFKRNVQETYEMSYKDKIYALFMDIGTKFKRDVHLTENVELIDVYPLLKTLLKLPNKASDYQTNIHLPKYMEDILEKSKL